MKFLSGRHLVNLFCSDCFDNKGKARGSFAKSGIDETSGILKEQFDILNAKLDRILRSLEPTAINEPVPKENPPPKIKETKEIKSKKAAKKTSSKKKKHDSKDKVIII